MISVVMIVPASEREAARAALEAAGFGPNNISVPMRGPVRVDSVEQATHYGTHWWLGDEFDTVVGIVREAAPNAAVLAHIPQPEGAEPPEAYEPRDAEGFELFDSEGGTRFYVPVDPMLIDGLNIGLGKLTGIDLPYAVKIEHASLWPVLEMRERDIIPISLSADTQPLIEVLTAFVAGGGLTQEELDGIVGAVGAMAGQVVQLRDFIPASWTQYILSREQAEAAGYFTDDRSE